MSKEKEYLFNLPEEGRAVQIYAFALAYECAYIVIRDKKELNHIGLDAMAYDACMRVEKTVVEGKQGTNDPELYRKTFLEAFTALYPLARQNILSGKFAIDPTWPDAQRHATLLIVAQQSFALVERQKEA